MKLFQFNRSYTIYAISLFLIEVWIAIVFKEGFIRHTFGDYLVVILLYCALKSVFNIRSLVAVGIVFLVAFGIEFLQLTSMLQQLGLQDSSLAKLILGSTFQITDLIAYTLGCITLLIIEQKQTIYE